jgi:hypothetical protein
VLHNHAFARNTRIGAIKGTTAFGRRNMFNNMKFLEDVRKVHLQSNEEFAAFNAVTDVRNRRNDMTLCEFVGDELTLIHRSLDNICANVVGETMFRLLMAKKNPKELKITNIGPQEAKEKLVKQLGSSYGNGEVQINLNLYDLAGIGIQERQYYGINANNTQELKPKSVSNSLFHEFTHCLHDIEDSSDYCRAYNQEDHTWGDHEEMRTIAGYMGTYDPICENCFDLCGATANGTKFLPRIGHFGYTKGAHQYSAPKLLQIYKQLPFRLDWMIKYV